MLDVQAPDPKVPPLILALSNEEIVSFENFKLLTVTFFIVYNL